MIKYGLRGQRCCYCLLIGDRFTTSKSGFEVEKLIGALAPDEKLESDSNLTQFSCPNFYKGSFVAICRKAK